MAKPIARTSQLWSLTICMNSFRVNSQWSIICLGLFAEGASKRRPLDLVAASIERPLQVLGGSRSPKFAEACYFVSLIHFLHCYTPVIPDPIERDWPGWLHKFLMLWSFKSLSKYVTGIGFDPLVVDCSYSIPNTSSIAHSTCDKLHCSTLIYYDASYPASYG